MKFKINIIALITILLPLWGNSQNEAVYYMIETIVSQVPSECCDTLHNVICHVHYPATDSVFSIYARITRPADQSVYFEFEIPLYQSIELPQGVTLSSQTGHAVITWPGMLVYDKEFEIRIKYFGSNEFIVVQPQQ